MGGKDGDISISSESFFLDNGLIFSESGILIPSDDGSNVDLIGGKGNGGDIYMNIGSAEISGGMISANTLGTGKAGNISISGELLNIRDGAKIVADNGNIYIDEAGNIIDGTMIGGKGDSGNIALNVNQLEMHSASVSYNTLRSGTGGNVSITAGDFVSIAGSGTDDAEHPADFYHGVSTQARGTGNGGHITIETDTLNLFTDAMINGQTYAEGQGGDVTLSINRLNVHEGGTVTTSSRGSGPAGDINIQAEDAVNLFGAGVKLGKSHIFTATHSSGRSGDVTLSTRTLTLGENGLMSAESLGKGNAGNIRLNVSNTFRADNAAVKTSAEQADGGDIFLNTKKRIYMTDSALTTSVSDGQGNGGNITIDPEFVILNNTQITANAHGGTGGNISIISEHYIRSAGSVVNASSELGIDGSVYIASPDEDATSGITVLSDNFPDMRQKAIMRKLSA